MKQVKIPTNSGKLIQIYDDYFTYNERATWHKFIKNSLFKSDGSDYDETNRMQLYSSYSLEDVSNMGFLHSPGFKKINEEHQLLDKGLKQLRVNLSPPSECATVHTDGNGLTLVYYANLEWDLSWGGQTLFMDDTLSEAEYTCLYKPGRIVLFDGSIPHMITSVSFAAKAHRYSFAIQAN
jgi:Rps23 Pro-64 3,4-dihydroxylase Tpa1-like proline 4-hydroxylase